MVTYYAQFTPSEAGGSYTITFPDFGWGATQGETVQHCLEAAADLLHDLLAHMIQQDEELPAPRKRSGRLMKPVTLPPFESAKVELYRAFKASGIRKATLARRLGIPRANVNRLFDLNHSTRFDQLEAAFRALGKMLVIDVRDAA